MISSKRMKMITDSAMTPDLNELDSVVGEPVKKSGPDI